MAPYKVLDSDGEDRLREVGLLLGEAVQNSITMEGHYKRATALITDRGAVYVGTMVRTGYMAGDVHATSAALSSALSDEAGEITDAYVVRDDGLRANVSSPAARVLHQVCGDVKIHMMASSGGYDGRGNPDSIDFNESITWLSDTVDY